MLVIIRVKNRYSSFNFNRLQGGIILVFCVAVS